MYMNDTHPETLKVLISGYRRMSPQQKLKQINDLTKTVQLCALSRIKEQYGEISEQEQKLRLASLWIDRKTMIKAFGWDPKEKGY